jgi:CRISPR-associated endonuclease Csn1
LLRIVTKIVKLPSITKHFEKIMKVLGLDLGSNSVGWALLEYHNGELERILGAGSRIVPLSPDLKTAFERGNTLSKTADRRMKRGARRLNHRFKMRRDNLLKFFETVGALPEGFVHPSLDSNSLDNAIFQRQLTDTEFYTLRAKAATEKVSLGEFARVLYHLNQRRGYKPNRRDKKKSETGTGETLVYAYHKIQSVTESGVVLRGKPEYIIKLSDGLAGTSTDEQFNLKIGETVPLKIKTRTNKQKEETVDLSLIAEDEQSWEDRLGAIESELARRNITPGQYFHQRISDAKRSGQDFKVREHLVYRWRYEAEFDLIWDTQAKFHQELSDKAILEQAIETVLPKNSPDKNRIRKKGTKFLVKEYIIYYQRKLKTKKSTIGHCEFEPLKRVIPKSHPLFQEFRIWNQITNLKIEDEEGNLHPITDAQVEILLNNLNGNIELPHGKVAIICGVAEEKLRMTDSLSGNETRVQLRAAADKARIKWESLAEKEELLWHILYSLEEEDDEVIEEALEKHIGIPREKSMPFLGIYFKKDYGSLSARAIKRILPLMKRPPFYDEAEVLDVVRVSIEKVLHAEDADVSDKVRELLSDCKEVGEVNGLLYWAAAGLVYGSHSRLNLGDAFNSWEEIKTLKTHSLRNAVVEQIINETLMVVKDIWKTFGRPDEIHLEMLRSLKQNSKQRQKSNNKRRNNERVRKEAEKELINGFELSRPSRKDVDRYLLWVEAQHRCVYTGKSIPKSALFNGETDIDHVLPRQRFFDDSFTNRVLTFKDVNKEKTNLTSYEYMQSRDWDEFKKRVEDNPNFSYTKKKNLLREEIPDDFINRQLNESSYIAKRSRYELERICPPDELKGGKQSPRVVLTSGSVTGHLKGLWGLNESFKRVVLTRFERMEKVYGLSLIEEVVKNGTHFLRIDGFSKRIDHRHHALDAIVVAATTRSNINTLNKLNGIYGNLNAPGKPARKIELPHPDIRDMVEDAMRGIIVSHKARTRLIANKPNQYSRRDESGKLIRAVNTKAEYTVRGQLHNETVYGSMQQYEKIPIAKAFENPEMIAVDWQRKKVDSRLAENKGDAKLASKSLKSKKLTDLAGEELKEVTILNTVFTTTTKLGESLTEKKLGNVADRKLRRELLDHLDRHHGVIKTAFSPKGILEFNRRRKKPVFKVRLLLNENFKPLSETGPNHRFVEGGNNYCLIVKEDKDGKRTLESRSFFDAVQLAMQNLDPESSEVGKAVFTLKAGEPVYVLRPDEEHGQVVWTDQVKLAERIWIYRKTSNESKAYFLPHTISEVLKKQSGFAIDEFGSQHLTEWEDSDDPRTKIIQNCLKVNIDRLGHISPFKLPTR